MLGRFNFFRDIIYCHGDIILIVRNKNIIKTNLIIALFDLLPDLQRKIDDN